MNLTEKQIALVPQLVATLRKARGQFVLDRDSYYENCCRSDGSVSDEEDQRVMAEMDAEIQHIDAVLEGFA